MDLSFWRSSNYGSVFWRSSDYRTWKNDHGEDFLLVSSKVKQNEPAAATKMNTSKFMKLEVCKCGESGGCRPINNVTSKSIFSSVLCGACHMLLDHFLHKHKWRSSKVTYSKTFWIHIQATSTVLMAKDRPLLVPSHFVASIGALLDPSSNAGCHCRGLNQAILML